jgi:hypothetical protein
MRKILALIIGLCAAAPAGAKYEIREEYRRDVINYDEESRSFLRQGFSADTGAARAFLSHTYLPPERQHIFNWSLELRDHPRGVSLMAGHYNASFGSGLFLGARRYSSPDPFAARPFPSWDSFISASRSASPLYSFSGLAARHEIVMDEARLETALFCTMRRRYIHFEDYDGGRVDSSMDSVNSRLERDGFYTEPVLLRDCGAAILLSCRQGLSAGLAAYGGDMRACSGRELLWDSGRGRDSESGIEGFSGSMLYMKYADDHLFAFCELGLTRSGAARAGMMTCPADTAFQPAPVSGAACQPFVFSSRGPVPAFTLREGLTGPSPGMSVISALRRGSMKISRPAFRPHMNTAGFLERTIPV